MRHRKLRRAVVDTCRAMNASGLNQGTSGNVSARAGDGFLITPSGIPYEDTKPGMLVAMDLDGGHEGTLKPSSEWRMHRDLYRARPDVGAVVHTHSTHATAYSCLRKPIPAFHYMIAVAGGRDLRCADYATFGTAELSEAMLVAMEGRTACLLANHGVIATGPDLRKALWLAGEVEVLAHQYILSLMLGGPTLLSSNDIAQAIERFRGYGFR